MARCDVVQQAQLILSKVKPSGNLKYNIKQYFIIIYLMQLRRNLLKEAVCSLRRSHHARGEGWWPRLFRCVCPGVRAC